MEICLFLMIFLVFMYVLWLDDYFNKKNKIIFRKIKEIKRLKHEINKNKKEINMLWNALDVVFEVQGGVSTNEKL